MDDLLVLRAKARATGANVHAVSNLCLCYAWCDAFRTPDEWDYWDAAMRKVEAQLQTFVKTGKLPPAGDGGPIFPSGPPDMN